MKFKDYLIFALCGLLAFTLISGGLRTARLNNDLADANSVITQQGELIETNEGLYEQTITELRSARQINRELEGSNNTLHERIRELDRTLVEYTEIIADFDTIAVQDTVFVDVYPDSIFVNLTKPWGRVWLNSYYFANLTKLETDTGLEYYENGVRIEYSLSTEDAIYNLQVSRDPIAIHYALSEDSSGNWIVDVDLPDYMSVSSIDGNILPYREKWYEKITFGIGLGTEPSLLTTIGYDHWLVMKRFNDQGGSWSVLRTFPLSKLWK